jgi:hypothetical protein
MHGAAAASCPHSTPIRRVDGRAAPIHTVAPRPTPSSPAPLQFFAVYDGHSSARGSEHASRRVHEFIAAEPAIQQCQVLLPSASITTWREVDGSSRVARRSACNLVCVCQRQPASGQHIPAFPAGMPPPSCPSCLPLFLPAGRALRPGGN